MSSGAVARGALAMLKLYLPSTLAAYRAAHPSVSVQQPLATSWLRVPPAALDTVADQVPAVTVWGGASLRWERIGQGWAAWYTLTVAALDRHDGWDTTADFAEAWETCLVTTMLAHPDLAGACDGLELQTVDPTVTRDRGLDVVVTTWRAYVGDAGVSPSGPYAPVPVADMNGIGSPDALSDLGSALGIDLITHRDPTSTVEAP